MDEADHKGTYLRYFRRCRKRETLEKMYQLILMRRLPPQHITAFELAADHRRAELVSGRLWDRIPPHLWRLVK